MSPDAYRASLRRLGLSQAGAARLFGIGERTARRFASEGAPSTVACALALAARLMDLGVPLEEIEAICAARGL